MSTERVLTEVRVRRLCEAASIPSFATAGAAGADLVAIEYCTIRFGEYGLVRTGIAFELPDGLEAQIRPRSGLALKHGITVLNSPATIDSDFRGELKVLLVNLGKVDFEIAPGDRIAQIVISAVTKVAYVESDVLSETDRGSGGFGSTGLRG